MFMVDGVRVLVTDVTDEQKVRVCVFVCSVCVCVCVCVCAFVCVY